MRSDVKNDEFLLSYEDESGPVCELTDDYCIGNGCDCCDIAINIAKAEADADRNLYIPTIRKTRDCLTAGKKSIEHKVSSNYTVAVFRTLEDALYIFNTDYKEIPYCHNSIMSKAYPIFFRLKSILSLGVPKKLLLANVELPMIAVYDHEVYVIAPRVEVE